MDYKMKVLGGTGIKMMKSFVLLLPCLLSVDGYFVDYRVAGRAKLQERQAFQCTKKGEFCNGCDYVVSCNGNGSTPEVLMVCPTDTKCNDEIPSPNCVTAKSRKCSDLNDIAFRCAMDGIYPDPIRCNVFYYCVPNAPASGSATTTPTATPTVPLDPSTGFTPNRQECQPYYSYNVDARYCNTPLPGNVCPTNKYPVKLCTYPGEMFQVQGPTYCRCIQAAIGSFVLYPYLYRCQTGKSFTGIHPC